MYMDSDRLDVKSERINMNRTEKLTKKHLDILIQQDAIFCLMAGVTGIEPALAVLETVVLPLYDTPVAA